jgi:hypothetical protein
MLQDIVSELERPNPEGRSVPQSRVLKWMESDDVETIGATYRFIISPRHVERVDPPLDFDSVFDFVLGYYEICLKTNPQSEWADSCTSAGMDMIKWFVWMWDEGRDRKYFDAMKSRLANLYLSGTPELKKRVVQGVVEHLFEREPIRVFFSDWRDNEQLRPAYDEGMLWIEGGGTSPLTERLIPPS